MRWSADDIPAQADNTTLATWTDSVGGIAANAAGTAPKYRTGGAGGKPYVLYIGTGRHDAGTGSNAVATACQSGVNTSLVVFRNALATTYGFLFTASNSTGYQLTASGTRAGMGINNTSTFPYTATGLSTVGYTAGKPDPTTGRAYVNGTCVDNTRSTAKSTAGHNLCIGGSTANTATDAKAEIYDVIVWNRALSASEMMQVEKWARDKYASAYPWAGQPFRIFHGDSIMSGLYASASEQAPPAPVAATNGWALGTWTNLGHPGALPAGLSTEAQIDVDPIKGIVGVPVRLAYFEWYNEAKSLAGDTTANGDTAAAATYAYLTARRAYADKIVLGTSTDVTSSDANDKPIARARYNSNLVSGYASYADALVSIHTDSGIGVENSCPASSPFTPNFYDGIHLTDAGYNILGGLFAPGLV